jgi:hypothetical protein
MNRFGGIFHPAAAIHDGDDDKEGMDLVDGAVALQTFERFYAELLHDHVRPLGRHFFKQYIRSDADDGESYAFTIRYRADEDVRLKEHTDASLYTININLNSDDDMDNKDDGAAKVSSSYDGSSVYFVTEDDDDDETDEETRANMTTRRRTTVTFAPGSAVMHRGQIRHGTMPLTSGERTNLVIWVYGEHGYVRVQPYDDDDGDDAGILWRNHDEL